MAQRSVLHALDLRVSRIGLIAMRTIRGRTARFPSRRGRVVARHVSQVNWLGRAWRSNSGIVTFVVLSRELPSSSPGPFLRLRHLRWTGRWNLGACVTAVKNVDHSYDSVTVAR